ncbi:MAG: hypothetical protein JRI68_28545, partial [Deltaproteobacteria bacterium]|nr:hypothetical protein [Deltaproteobacteria bacterium]
WKKSSCETGKCAAAKSHLTTLKRAAGELGCGLNKKLYTCTMNAKVPQVCNIISRSSQKKQSVIDVFSTLGCLNYYNQYKAAWKVVEDYKKSAIRPLCHQQY